MSKRVADVLVETLQAAGVKTCYGIVGDTLNRIAHAIERSEIDWVHMRHEEAGAFAANAEPPYAVHARVPLVRPSDEDLDEIAAILNKSDAITIYAGAGCAGAHDEVVATAARLHAPMVHTSRGKDFLEYDNPYNVGMTGILGGPAGYHAVRDCDVLLLLGADFAWSQYYPDKATIIQIDAD